MKFTTILALALLCACRCIAQPVIAVVPSQQRDYTVGSQVPLLVDQTTGALLVWIMTATPPVTFAQADTTNTLLAAISSKLSGTLTTSATVTPPALTKGTQGSTGFTVQNLNDAGRVAVHFYATGVASGSTGTETAITLVRSSGTSATSSATSHLVTSGKRLRITSVMVGVRGNLVGTSEETIFSLRVNPSGAVTTSTTPVVLALRCYTGAVALASDRIVAPFPEGYEIPGDGTLQIGVTAQANFLLNAPTWDVLLTGYEY